MQTPLKNPCVRCGKERILVKTWTEKHENSLIKYTLALCPDEKCQKIVDAANNEREAKRLMHAQKRSGITLGKKTN